MDYRQAITGANIAIVVDDLAADRQLAARPLRRAGWTVHAARNSVEGARLIEQVLDADTAPRLVVLTDLHMPSDPAYGTTNRQTAAGAQFALQLRARMERGDLPRVPIIALTALTESEIHMTALAFGCDAVLSKPATPDLVARIQAALSAAQAEESDALGAGALLRLLRCRLAEVNAPQTTRAHGLTEQDITRALLAYHRQGISGLGQSTLAAALAPDIAGVVQRGEYIHGLLLRYLNEIMRLDVLESVEILRGELENQLSPAEQCAELGISLSEYYRRRREAVAVMFELLVGNTAKFG